MKRHTHISTTRSQYHVKIYTCIRIFYFCLPVLNGLSISQLHETEQGLDSLNGRRIYVTKGSLYSDRVSIVFYHMTSGLREKLHHAIKSINHYSCIDIYSYSCLHPLSNERKSLFKSGDSRAV